MSSEIESPWRQSWDSRRFHTFMNSSSVICPSAYVITLLCVKMADKDPSHQTPQHNNPHGMEPYDLAQEGNLGALSKEQQEKLNKFKVKTRIENEKYLREHPEVECLVQGFLQDVLTRRPEDIREFAADHFTDPELPRQIERKLEDRQRRIKQNRFLQKV